jgi:hypothetical protein
VFTLLHPELATRHASLLIAAAACGDFEEWATADVDNSCALAPPSPSASSASSAQDASQNAMQLPCADDADAAVKLHLALTAIGEASGGDGDAYAAALRAMPSLLSPGGLTAAQPMWAPGYQALIDAWASLRTPGGALSARRVGRIGVVTHAVGAAEAPGAAISRAFGGPAAAPPRTLLAFAQADGRWHYRYELPRHTWARTVSRPSYAAPDAGGLAAALAAAARAAAADEAAAAALSRAAWVCDGLPGMTAVLRTRVPMDAPPAAVAAALEAADAELAAMRGGGGGGGAAAARAQGGAATAR